MALRAFNGGSIVYPLFFDYPEDDNCFSKIEDTYMLGDALKVSPVLDPNVPTTFQSYFPAGNWADINSFISIVNSEGAY
jgi:alpha-glucosidase (family GH31 glycosyl hydrolase)